MSYRKIYLISYIFLNGDIFDYVIADFQPIITQEKTFEAIQMHAHIQHMHSQNLKTRANLISFLTVILNYSETWPSILQECTHV